MTGVQTCALPISIRPKTDPAFMFALLNVLLHEQRENLDLPFLKSRTGSPYLVAPNGFFLRDPKTDKPLIYDLKTGQAVPFDTIDMDPALEGHFIVSGSEKGADQDRWEHQDIEVTTAFEHLLEHIKPYTPLWASRV